MIHQGDVDHRGLIDDHESGVQGPVLIALEPAMPGTVFEESMDRFGIVPRGLRESLGGPSRRSSEKDPGTRSLMDPNNTFENRRFTCARPPCDDKNPASQGLLQSLPLPNREMDDPHFFCLLEHPI